MTVTVPSLTSIPPRSTRLRALRRLFRRPTALAAALLCAAIFPSVAGAAIWPPDDPFYAAPANIASLANGEVIRSRTTRISTLPGLQLPYKTFQVLYRTTDRRELPIASVATIIIPTSRPATGRRLLSYQTAYDGLSPACQPSYTLRTGRVALQGAETLLMSAALQRGWTVVTADYEGPDNTWLTSKTTGRGVLDGIRAAENYEPAGLPEGAETKVGMVGYSGGGQATAWASEMADEYAPELNIVGAAEGGVAPDFAHVLRYMDGQLFAGIPLAALAGISKGYPELNFDSYLNKEGKAVMKRLRTKQSCISDFAAAYPFMKIKKLINIPDLLAVPQFMAVADDTALGKHSPSHPMFIYHTVFEQMGSYSRMRELARQYCLDGTKVQFITGYKEEHAMQAFSMPFRAQAWMAERFDDKPMYTNCPNPK